MGLASLWESFSVWVMHMGLPAVGIYHLFCMSSFFNVSVDDAKGLEKMANVFLAPTQYLFAGRIATPVLSEDGVVNGYFFKQRFNYEDPSLWVKTAAAYCALPSSFVLGSFLKGVSLFSSDVRGSQSQISLSLEGKGAVCPSNKAYYESLGIELVDFNQAESVESEGHKRRPGDEDKLQIEKKALKQIISLLHAQGILYWLDCGTCLGAYRYGGNIPWDWDVDIAILQPDFDNVFQVLSTLDPSKYTVQDWSSRDRPKSYLKVYIKENHSLIDIYHFAIDAGQKEIHSIVSNEGSIFLPDSWKIRERRYAIPTPFSFVFPLKKIDFDGIEACVPNQTKRYLQQRYGENIGPVKIYSEITGDYEKDLSHPYWQEFNAR